VQIGDNRAAEWVRRSNPVALGLLFSGLAGQSPTLHIGESGSRRFPVSVSRGVAI
jgi:hypothetical protein